MQLPTIEHIAPNFTAVTVGDLTVWFSYETPVAFQGPGDSGPTVRRNDWGPTTGKHLNRIDGGAKASRLEGRAFNDLLISATLPASLTY